MLDLEIRCMKHIAHNIINQKYIKHIFNQIFSDDKFIQDIIKRL